MTTGRNRGDAGRLLLCLAAVALAAVAGCAVADRDAPEAGNGSPILIQPARLDMGEVMEGQPAEARLLVRNVSAFPVHIARVEASCGCTTTRLERRDLQPGEFAALTVRVDTRLKRGPVRKTVTVVEAGGARAVATLRLSVRSNPHAAMRDASLFAGRCARCHAEPARGKRDGAAIYAAVCAMCHGQRGRGAYAPPIAGLDAEAVRQTLRHGRGRAMPAFASDAGGPLDALQIAAVARWLSALPDGGPGDGALDGGGRVGYKSAP